MKISKLQETILYRCLRGPKSIHYPYDGRESRTFEALAKKGLIKKRLDYPGYEITDKGAKTFLDLRNIW